MERVFFAFSHTQNQKMNINRFFFCPHEKSACFVCFPTKKGSEQWSKRFLSFSRTNETPMENALVAFVFHKRKQPRARNNFVVFHKQWKINFRIPTTIGKPMERLGAGFRSGQHQKIVAGRSLRRSFMLLPTPETQL